MDPDLKSQVFRGPGLRSGQMHLSKDAESWEVAQGTLGSISSYPTMTMPTGTGAPEKTLEQMEMQRVWTDHAHSLI